MEKIVILFNKKMNEQEMNMLELSKKAGVDKALVHKLLNNKRKRPSFSTVIKIAKALKVSPNELLGESLR